MYRRPCGSLTSRTMPAAGTLRGSGERMTVADLSRPGWQRPAGHQMARCRGRMPQTACTRPGAGRRGRSRHQSQVRLLLTDGSAEPVADDGEGDDHGQRPERERLEPQPGERAVIARHGLDAVRPNRAARYLAPLRALDAFKRRVDVFHLHGDVGAARVAAPCLGGSSRRADVPDQLDDLPVATVEVRDL